MTEYYLTFKALHIISFVSWMAAMLYLPRLFVYHAQAKPGSELSETLKVMELKLHKYIMNPAMILTFLFGVLLIVITGAGGPGTGSWMHAKILLIVLLAGCHGMMSKIRKDFANDKNTRSAKFYKWFNELPTVLMIGIVFLAVLKPF